MPHLNLRIGLRAITLASILGVLPGCTSTPNRQPATAALTPPVQVLEVSDPQVSGAPTPGPNLVTDAEISKAQAALKDASAWGATYYEPRMYARAQAALDAAETARQGDPDGCRALLAEASAAAGSAKEAALADYQADVKARFEASREKLLSVQADRAFPDEFAGLVAGMDATAAHFAAQSYWDARLEAYRTLKGMGDLYDRVRGLQAWLEDARVRVEKALGTAREQDAAAWAPAELKEAEQKYQDALAQMQGGEVKSAADSMTAAGVIAARLPLLHDAAVKRTATVPPENVAATKVPPAAGPRPVAAPPLPSGQRVRIAEVSMSPLGTPQARYPAYSEAVARFDVVAAEGLRDPGVMEKVLAGLDENWEAAVSRSGYFGFIYNNRIEMVRDLGTYPDTGEFLHAPYAAQFRLAGTRFAVNLVVCHLEEGSGRAQPAGISRLASVHRYFEELTGNRGMTLLLAGGTSEMPRRASGPVASGDMVLLRSPHGPASVPNKLGQEMFGSSALQELVEQSGFGSAPPAIAYITLGRSR